MKLNVQPGPLPIAPPYFDWDDEEFERIESQESDEEIDLTDLFEPTKDTSVGN